MRLIDIKVTFKKWLHRTTYINKNKKILIHIFYNIFYIYWLRWGMRRWNTKIYNINHKKRQIDNLMKLTNEMSIWKLYTNLNKYKKRKLNSIFNMTIRACYRYVWNKWNKKVLLINKKRLSCIYLCKYGQNKFILNIIRISFSLWRTMNSLKRSQTINKLGISIDLLLKKIINNNIIIDNLNLSNVNLLTKVNDVISINRNYQYHIHSNAMKIITNLGLYKYIYNIMRFCYYQWNKLTIKLKLSRKVLYNCIRNCHRIDVRQIIGKRFQRWKKIIKINIINLIYNNNIQGKVCSFFHMFVVGVCMCVRLHVCAFTCVCLCMSRQLYMYLFLCLY